MFGYPLHVELDGFGVTLKPPRKAEIPKISELFGSMVIHKYTRGVNAPAEEDEIEWWERARKDRESVVWAIYPAGTDTAIGITSLNRIHPFWGCCTSGIIIFNKDYWGRGVAYRSHLARTWYAANTLNRLTIQSEVRTKNVTSLKVLLKVGYRVSGSHDRNFYRDGVYLDTYILSWVNPHRIGVLYPDGAPKELQDSLEKAKNALELADRIVNFL